MVNAVAVIGLLFVLFLAVIHRGLVPHWWDRLDSMYVLDGFACGAIALYFAVELDGGAAKLLAAGLMLVPIALVLSRSLSRRRRSAGLSAGRKGLESL